jgi:Ca2+-binding RTX toxin-like protein
MVRLHRILREDYAGVKSGHLSLAQPPFSHSDATQVSLAESLVTKGAAAMAAQPPEWAFSMIEPLEQRQMLTANLDQGTLFINGTHVRDRIIITQGGSADKIKLTLNGEVFRFTVSDVKLIRIQAGQGDDIIDIDNGKRHLRSPTLVYGSGGDDTITTGRGRDRIYGGGGDDVIRAGDGRDIVYGEGGADSIDGQEGSDVIDGGQNDDTVKGGRGVDRVSGGRNEDLILIGDHEVDSGNGGPGIDTANADDLLDDLNSVENT